MILTGSSSYAFRPPEKVSLQEIVPRFTLKLCSLKKNIPAVYNLGESPAPLTIGKDDDKDDSVGELEGRVEEDEKENQPSKQCLPTKAVVAMEGMPQVAKSFLRARCSNFCPTAWIGNHEANFFLATSYVEAIASIDYRLSIDMSSGHTRQITPRALNTDEASFTASLTNTEPTLNSPPGQSRAGGSYLDYTSHARVPLNLKDVIHAC
jgi:hypothetical protein